MYEYLPLLHKQFIFKDISDPDIYSLLQCLGAYINEFDADQNILAQPYLAGKISVVLHGTLQLSRKTTDGQETPSCTFFAGDPLHIGAFSSLTECGFLSLRATHTCTMLFISSHRMMNACVSACSIHYKMTQAILEAFARRNLRTMEQLEILSKKTIRERILIWLTQQSQKQGSLQIDCPMRRIELAEYLCIDRSALTRELTHMKLDGLIDFHKNNFWLLQDNPEACQHIAQIG